jgi:NRPS condensation-like uncharacterized protein
MLKETHEHRPQDTAPDFLRPLGGFEQLFHVFAQVYPVHFCLCAEIGAAIDADALRSALDRVRERHPLLRVRILEDERFGTAFYRSDRPIALETIAVEHATDWHPAVKRELETPIDAEAGSLLRVTALCARATTTIILTFHHVIADALSAVWVFHDLMRALAGEPLEAFQSSPPVEGGTLGRFPDPEFLKQSNRTRPISSPPIASIDLPTHLATAELSQSETARLVECCRANGATVHGAICAVAARHIGPTKGDVMRLACSVDVRKMAGIESGACGLFVANSSVELTVDEALPIWHDARHVSETLVRFRSREGAGALVERMSVEFPPTAQSDKFLALASSFAPTSVVISNLGVLPIAERYGAYAVNAVWGPVMLTIPPKELQTLGICTFGGRLRIVHQSYGPIPGLASAIRDSLLAVCR